MSVLHTVLAIDGSDSVLSYLDGLGLKLPQGFRSRHPTLGEVRSAVARMAGWRLGEPDHPEARRFWCDLYRDNLSVTALLFAAPDGADRALLSGARGDPCLQLLRELAKDSGPLVLLLNAEEPLLVEATKG